MTFCTCCEARIGSTAGLSRRTGYTTTSQQADTAGKTCAAIRANDAPPHAAIPVTSGLRPVAPALAPLAAAVSAAAPIRLHERNRLSRCVGETQRNSLHTGTSPLKKNKRSVSRLSLRERLRPTHRAFRTNNASSQARTLRTRATPSAPGCRRRQPAPGPSARTAPRHQE